MAEAVLLSLTDYIDQCRTRVDAVLSATLPRHSPVSPRLLEAMDYSLFNGGKRIRPILVYASCCAVGGSMEQADPAASAVEFVHAYSLVHDDLPAMDNDDLRRGKPTCHRAYDEATAILVGDTLQSLAFDVLSNPDLHSQSHLTESIRLKLVRSLSRASGLEGMAGGQAMDQYATGQILDRQQLELMHSHKTGALIRASVHMGALSGGCHEQEMLDALEYYAQAIGLAFQVQDDILDVISDTVTLGKHQGADIALDKPTYVSLMGLDQAKSYAQELHNRAVGALSEFGEEADFLRQIADYIVRRSY
ncbi:farnesyl diphosphate synthase [uncultured Endozoicomonas sp.]|uniref:polyprenyl synthetase family protein n=1 Tax=uncultured Endozoicomonas sp. TaxID=432652 RepID=UPI00260E45B9|nr:farnesyl diphosphate synthase [uncultured Endozoicomonas sp.]